MAKSKVILPREVVETLDAFIGGGMNNEEILRRVLDGDCEDLAYFTDKIDDLMWSLLVGYDISAFDKVEDYYCSVKSRKYFSASNSYTSQEQHFTYELKGIEKTVEILSEQYPELKDLHKKLIEIGGDSE